jgi:hypothetical protein
LKVAAHLLPIPFSAGKFMKSITIKQKKISTGHKGRNIFFSSLLFISVVITGGVWYWNTHKKAIIKNKIETVVLEKSNGLYQIAYDSLEMNEIDGYLSISNINFFYDSTRFTELEKLGKAPSILLNIQIPVINISGVKTPRALLKSEIVGRKLEIKNPVITIYITSPGKDSGHAIASKELYEQLLGNLDLIQADTILISNAQITTINHQSKKVSSRISNAMITLIDVKIDSTSYKDSSRMAFAKQVSIACGKTSWSSPKGLYNYSFDTLDIHSVSRHLVIKSFRMTPTLNEEAFVKSLPTQDDRFDFYIDNIQVKNVSLPQLFEENFIADSIIIQSARIKIYRDLAIPRDKKNRVGSYPHQLMQTLPFIFRVEKLVMKNSFIEYKERHPITRMAGKIQYYNVNATISNLTNDKQAIAINNIMTVEMSTKFLNNAPLKVNAHFYLLHPRGRFDLEGSIGAMDATLLNPVIERTGLTHILKGRVNSAEFNLKGYDDGIDGRVKLLYEDLKVAALEKDRGSTDLDKKAFASFYVNILIKNSNPKNNAEARIAQVHLDRNINSSFFNSSWHALFKGIMETVGLQQ